MRRVIISGGGTGGHIYPAITIARAIADIEPTEFLYVGSKIGLENTLIPKEGLPFVTLDVRGLERKISVRNLVTLGKTAGSLIKAEGIIRKFKPDVVIGTGGFVCGPVLLAASLSGVPTLIQEQNVIPGVTNTILSRFVNRVALGYEEAAARFKRKDILVYTGNPVRKDILTVTREEGRKALGLDPDKFTLLVAGGSRGARSINTAMIEVHKYFRNDEHIQILHVTGDHEYDRVVKQLPGIECRGRYGKGSRIIPYLHHMPEALAACDLAVYRAGAVGLAELTVRGVPSILIPYPYAAEDHQRYNAQALVMCGAAKMILDKMLTGRELLEEIIHLKDDPKALAAMAQASRSMGKPQAAHDIAELALGLDPDKFTLLVAGGSRGARSINTAMIEVHKYFRNDEHIQILHVTGDHEYDRVVKQLPGIECRGRYGKGSRIIPYLHHMPEALAACDLAVYRAGAVGLAELTVRGVPSILIPYPYAAEDHQRYNAQALVMCGAAKMILDKMLTGRELLEEIIHLKDDPKALAAMAQASRSMGKPQAAHDIAELALSIARKRRR